jgi:hypothetical protein
MTALYLGRARALIGSPPMSQGVRRLGQPNVSRIASLNCGSRREEALASSARIGMSLLTWAATRFMKRRDLRK